MLYFRIKSGGLEKTLALSFPEEYHADHLAGKAAVFACKVHAIEKKKTPELDDELAKSFGGFDTLGDLRTRISEDMTKNKERQSKDTLRQTVLGSLAERSPFDVPDGIPWTSASGRPRPPIICITVNSG